LITLNNCLLLGGALFAIGVFGVLTRRNAIGILISIEVMLAAVNLNLVAFSRFVEGGGLNGQIFSIFVMTVAAAEAAIGLALVLALYRSAKAIYADRFSLLKW
jgi:NAD(P)H-quinone oxidoreductase subunit 4L